MNFGNKDCEPTEAAKPAEDTIENCIALWPTADTQTQEQLLRGLLESVNFALLLSTYGVLESKKAKEGYGG